MDRLNQLREAPGGSRDCTLDTTSPPSEAFTTANEGSSKYFSLSEVDSTFDISSIKDVSLPTTTADSDGTITNTEELISNLSPISKENYKIGEQIEAANILSGGVNIFDDNENSYDGDELVIDDNVDDDKSNPELKPSGSLQGNMEATLINEEADIASKDTEVVLQIDGKNVDAIDIGNGLYLYRKEGEEELAAVQIIDDDQHQPSFKFLKVRENAEGNLEVYEEIEIEVPKKVPVKEGKTVNKNTPLHVPIKDINKVISEPASNKPAEKKSPQKEPTSASTEVEADINNDLAVENKAEVNFNGKMMKYSDSRKSPVIGSFTPMTYHSTPNKEGKPLTKTMVDLQLHPSRHSDNVKKTIEVHTDSSKPRLIEMPLKNKDLDDRKTVEILISDDNKTAEISSLGTVILNVEGKEIVEPEKNIGEQNKNVVDTKNNCDHGKIGKEVVQNVLSEVTGIETKTNVSLTLNEKKVSNMYERAQVQDIIDVEEKNSQTSVLDVNDKMKDTKQNKDSRMQKCIKIDTVQNEDERGDKKITDELEKGKVNVSSTVETTDFGTESESDITDEVKVTKPTSNENTEMTAKSLESKIVQSEKSTDEIFQLTSSYTHGKTEDNTKYQNISEPKQECSTSKPTVQRDVRKDCNQTTNNDNSGSVVVAEISSKKIVDKTKRQKDTDLKIMEDYKPLENNMETKQNIVDNVAENIVSMKNPKTEDKGKEITMCEFKNPELQHTQPDKLLVGSSDYKGVPENKNTTFVEEVSMKQEVSPKIDGNLVKEVITNPKEIKILQNTTLVPAFREKIVNKDIGQTFIPKQVNEIGKHTDSESIKIPKIEFSKVVSNTIKQEIIRSSLNKTITDKEIKSSTTPLDKKDIPKLNTEPKPVNNNHTAVPFGKWTDANRQEFLNKFKSKVPATSSNGNQIKNSNDLNRRDVLKKIDSQRQSSNALSKAQDTHKLSTKNETAFSKTNLITQESKIPVKSETLEIKVKPAIDKNYSKAEIKETPTNKNQVAQYPTKMGISESVSKKEPKQKTEGNYQVPLPVKKLISDNLSKKDLKQEVNYQDQHPVKKVVSDNLPKKGPNQRVEVNIQDPLLIKKVASDGVSKKEPKLRTDDKLQDQHPIKKKICLSKKEPKHKLEVSHQGPLNTKNAVSDIVPKKEFMQIIEVNYKDQLEKIIVVGDSVPKSEIKQGAEADHQDPPLPINVIKNDSGSKKEPKPRTEVNYQDLIDKTIEDMLHRGVPVKAGQDESTQSTEKDSSSSTNASSYQQNYPPIDEIATLDAIEMKMNELHGIPFIERPAHELPKVLKTDVKSQSKPDKEKTTLVSKPIKVPNLLSYANKNQQKSVNDKSADLDSEEEVIEHEPVTGDIDLNKQNLVAKISVNEKLPCKSTAEKNSCDSSKKEPIITEKDFDKFARRNSMTYENRITVNFESKEVHNVIQTVVQKDYTPKNDVISFESKTTSLQSNQNVRKTQNDQLNFPSKRNIIDKSGTPNDEPCNRNQSKVQKAYQSALTAKRQMECPITIIEDKPVKVVYMDTIEYTPSHLNVQGQDLSPAKKLNNESDLGTSRICDTVDSDMVENTSDMKSQDEIKVKTKHQRKQVLTPVTEPELELIEPRDLGIDSPNKKKRKTEDDKAEKNTKYLMRKKMYLLSSSTLDETQPKIQEIKNPLTESANRNEHVRTLQSHVSAIDNLVKAAELIENQSENTLNVTNTSIEAQPNTLVKRGRGRPRKYPVPEGVIDSKGKLPSPQKKPRLIDAKLVKRDPITDEEDEDSNDEIVRENWTMGKINENIVCPICNKLFRTENVVFKHVKHCTGPSPNRSDSDKRSPRRLRQSQESDESKSDDIDDEDDKRIRKKDEKETPKKHKSKDSVYISDVSSDDVISIEDTPDKEKPGKLDDRKQHESRKQKTNYPHKNNDLVCEFCGKTFRQLSYLVNHKQHHKKEGSIKAEKEVPVVNKSVHSCDVCKKEFRKLHHLVQHRIIHNPQSMPVRSLRKSSSEQSETKGEKNPSSSKPSEDASAGFRCEPCDKSFRKLHHLVEHRETHDGINRQKNTSVSQNSAEKPITTHSCDVCKKTFRKLHYLIEHKEQHMDTGSEKSDDKSVKSSLSTKDIIHECSLCYMVFPNEHSLNKHTVICQRKKRQSKQKQEEETELIEKTSEDLTIQEIPDDNTKNPNQNIEMTLNDVDIKNDNLQKDKCIEKTDPPADRIQKAETNVENECSELKEKDSPVEKPLQSHGTISPTKRDKPDSNTDDIEKNPVPEKIKKVTETLEKVNKNAKTTEKTKVEKSFLVSEDIKKVVEIPEKIKKTVEVQEKFKKVIEVPEKVKKTVVNPETIKKNYQEMVKIKKVVEVPKKSKKEVPEKIKKDVEPEKIKKDIAQDKIKQDIVAEKTKKGIAPEKNKKDVVLEKVKQVSESLDKANKSLKEAIKIHDTPKKKTPLKDKVTPNSTKRSKISTAPIPAADALKLTVEASDDDEIRYMLNPNFKVEETEEKVFMRVKAQKRNSFQIERPNSKDLVKRRISLQHPPKIPRLKQKPNENKATVIKNLVKPTKLESVPSTDSDDSDVKYSFPKVVPDKATNTKPTPEHAVKDVRRKTPRKALSEKRKSLSSIAKRKSVGKAVIARHKASPIKQIKRRTLGVEHRCDCGQLFSSAALLARHTTLAHTPPRIRRRRSPPPEPPAQPEQRKSAQPTTTTRKSSVRSDSSTSKPKTEGRQTRRSTDKAPERKLDPDEHEKSGVKAKRTSAHRGVPVPEKMKKMMQKNK